MVVYSTYAQERSSKHVTKPFHSLEEEAIYRRKISMKSVGVKKGHTEKII